MTQKNGFTLVEVLVTILVLSASLALILPAFTRTLYVSSDSQQRLIAVKLAQQGLELMRTKRDNNTLCLQYSCTDISRWDEGIADGSVAYWLPDSTDVGGLSPGMTFPVYSGSFTTFDSSLSPICVSTQAGPFNGQYTLCDGVDEQALPGNFKRVIKVTQVTDPSGWTDSVAVTSKVVWGVDQQQVMLSSMFYRLQ